MGAAEGAERKESAAEPQAGKAEMETKKRAGAVEAVREQVEGLLQEKKERLVREGRRDPRADWQAPPGAEWQESLPSG